MVKFTISLFLLKLLGNRIFHFSNSSLACNYGGPGDLYQRLSLKEYKVVIFFIDILNSLILSSVGLLIIIIIINKTLRSPVIFFSVF